MLRSGCYYERLLSQILLGTRPTQVITIMPRLNLGPAQGRRLAAAVTNLVETAQGLMRGDIGNLSCGFSFGLTEVAAGHLGNSNILELGTKELGALFTYQFSPDTQKKRRQEAQKRLKIEFGADVEELNAACERHFADWEAAVQALIKDRI